MRNYLFIPIFLGLLLVLLTTTTAFSQSNKLGNKDLKRNAVYGEIGYGALNSYVHYSYKSIHYERIISQQLDIKNASLILKVGLGQMYNMSYENLHFYSKIHYGLLLGAKHSKIELSVGFTYMNNMKRWHTEELHLSGFIGWRYQRVGNPLIFKVGIGYPDYFVFSVGWAF